MEDRIPKDVLKTLGKLSAIQFLRLSGVFFVLPLIAIYAQKFTQNDVLIGLSLGAYEISMAIMQIPAGIVSKKIGRKNYIFIGLAIFVIGNLISFYAFSIFTLIVGRFVAGLGAISTPVSSIAMDSVPKERRNTAMAIIGIGIGFAFLAGIGIAPLVASFIGIDFFFLISAIFGLIGIVAMKSVKEPTRTFIKMEKDDINPTNGRVRYLMFFGTLFLAITSFLIFYSLQTLSYLDYGIFNYGVLLFIGLLISGIIAVSISEIVYRKRKFNIIALSSALIVIGVFSLFIGIILKLNFLYLALCIIPFFTGFSIYEISAIPLLNNLIGEGKNNVSFGVFYAFQYGGDAIGAILGGTFAFSSSRITSVDMDFAVAVILSVFSGLMYLRVTIGQYNSRKLGRNIN
jgi:predicted MFS family arabinose efflux permease